MRPRDMTDQDEQRVGGGLSSPLTAAHQYCRNHRSFFCPCVAEGLYRKPFVTKREEWSLADHREEWGRAEREYQERQLERRFRSK